MNRHASQARPPVLVISGMHRSTTSLAASILAAAGLNLGDDLMLAGTGNEAGHFEDNDFYLLHQRILAANGLSMEGYTCEERIDVPATARDQALQLLARRRAAGRPWGWKDPRTVLFLDFWAELLPEARWLFVVRSPWEVVDSLFRRGDTAFRANPRFAGEVWVAYNRRILEFVQARPDHTAVIQSADVIADHTDLVRTASTLLGTPLETPPSRFRPELFVAGQPSHRAGLVRAASPDAHDIYRSLIELAGGPRQGTDRGGSPPRLAEVAAAGLIEWNHACQAIAERGGFSAQVTGARQALETASQELAAEREAVARLQAHVDELTRDLVTERAARAEVTTYAEHLAQELTTERAARAEVTAHAEAIAARLDAVQAAHGELESQSVAQQAAMAEERRRLEADLVRARDQLDSQRSELENRLARADREWSNRLDAERRTRQQEAAQFMAAVAVERERADALIRDAEMLAVNHEAERAETIKRHSAEQDLVISQLEAERDEMIAGFRADRDALAAQLDAERGIYEGLREDLTGRIEVARSIRRKAG